MRSSAVRDTAKEQLPPSHIRRGVSVAQALKGFGSVFRTRPDTLGDRDKAALYQRSEQAEHIDAFLSHSWGSPGLQKYLCLVLAEGGVWAVLANLCLCVSTVVFQSFVWERHAAMVRLPAHRLLVTHEGQSLRAHGEFSIGREAEK